MKLDLRLSSQRSAFVVGEDITIGIEMENRGSARVQIPDPEMNTSAQPVYELRGPGPQDVLHFDFRSCVHKHGFALGASAETPLLDLAPTAKHAASLDLSALVPGLGPGRYTFSARLTWNGLDIKSPPLPFSIDPLKDRERGFHFGLAQPVGTPPELYAAWLHAAAGATPLFLASCGERRPELGGLSPRSVVRIGELGPSASDVLVPWTAHSRFEDLIGWVLWREGRELCGLPTMSGGPLRMTLPFVPAFFVLPPLESRAHTVELFLIGGPSARALAMVRVLHAGIASPPRGSVLWTIELPEPALAAAVAAPLASFDLVRHLAIVSATAEETRVCHFVVEEGRPPRQLEHAQFQGWTASKDAPPALLADESGGARVSLLLLHRADPHRGQLLETLCGPSNSRGQVAPPIDITLPVPIAQAQIRYCRDPASGTFRRDFALRGADGATYVMDPDGGVKLARAATKSPPPFALIVLPRHSYLLDRSPEGAYLFVQL
ncbi:hypothetical protein [Haliangium sp. UPWRP_2]|uniref:hypothetical protein n=1 Tax=Haliangium sp. UPWRP_2 TaxID=1931276 RepID=UPI000B54191A|nr:hypothetical protein [Haliangium sp. UPWRP_2]PSM31388.1 hypothetical protein BVG81_005665 [Haliangium sp. UPWRP_2]